MSEDDLETRVKQFRTMSLPGQGFSMHMGTSALVSDLWTEIQRLRVSHRMLFGQESFLPNTTETGEEEPW
jgi:hypothetical protein